MGYADPRTDEERRIAKISDDAFDSGWNDALNEVDNTCRLLMIRSAEDQATVRAVASALDKVRVRIRELRDQEANK